MQTLSQLRAGELDGVKRLTLSENLTEFPLEILTLADSLEVLDLSNNQLTTLPTDFAQLINLKIFFASNNPFVTVPEVLGLCANLEMIGFKSNQIAHVPELSLPAKLRWLILTDNCIEDLPNTIGQRPRLQKLALAGNRLTSLPLSMAQLHNLELLRISANQLTECPRHILELPKLAWLAFAGNPFCRPQVFQPSHDPCTYSEVIQVNSVPTVSATSYTLEQVLGEGASGVISKARWKSPKTDFPADIAVKVFKGEVTSDGYPEDELQACLKVGNHPNVVKSLAQVNDPDQLALVMALIPPHYANLGLPPNLQSCTRDIFPAGFSLSIEQIIKILKQMVSVFNHLHDNHVCHGDLYAHNTLFDAEANIIFGDFGAASMYHMLPKAEQQLIKGIEERALTHFIADLLSVCRDEDIGSAEYHALEEWSWGGLKNDVLDNLNQG